MIQEELFDTSSVDSVIKSINSLNNSTTIIIKSIVPGYTIIKREIIQA